MKNTRIPYSQGDLVNFFEEGLGALGGLCSRTWHDRLEVVTEGALSQLWGRPGALDSRELSFVSPDTKGARSAEREVFPGCPITFRLCEQLIRPTEAVPCIALAAAGQNQAPSPEVAEKLWKSQQGDCRQWKLATPFRKSWHFSLVMSVRFEIQSIDQQWSLHRVAVSLKDGYREDTLARDLERLDPISQTGSGPDWAGLGEIILGPVLGAVFEAELVEELAEVRKRQSVQLQRELSRIDTYFENYARELRGRKTKAGALKLEERLAATQLEHERHRQDQVSRHEIVVLPHVDTLLLVAEPAFEANLFVKQAQEGREVPSRFICRSRRWVLDKPLSS